ncbi:MAG: hypothetical protein ACJ8AB_13790 [Gemmatimonadaceae bacterium]
MALDLVRGFRGAAAFDREFYDRPRLDISFAPDRAIAAQPLIGHLRAEHVPIPGVPLFRAVEDNADAYGSGRG